MKILCRMLSTGFYTGYTPIAPGTVGSVFSLVLFVLIPGFRDITLFIITLGIFFLGVFVAGEVEKSDGPDPSIVNIDEIVGMWISIIFLPGDLSWIWLIAAFLIFRLFDILKPFPVNVSQRLPGGWGVMIDDILAGIYTNLVLRIFIYIFTG